MIRIRLAAQYALLVAAIAVPASAGQISNPVTQSEIQGLQDNVYLADRDVSQLRTRDQARANQLATQVDDLRDEVIYLKVKLRKEGTVSRTEFNDLRSRIDGVRSQARDDAPAGPHNTAGALPRDAVAPPAPRPQVQAAPPQGPARAALPRGTIEIPTGTQVDVRLQNTLNSGTAQAEDRFEGTTLMDLVIDGRTAIPAGAVMRGIVSSVEPATRTTRTAKMTLSFDQVTINGRAYPMRGTVTNAIQGEGIKGDLPKAGAGAAVGGILGAVLGGGKGAVLGAIIGGGGTVAATEGKQVELPQGTTLTVQIDSPLDVQAAR
jgi:hypothetical protein